MKWWPGAGTGLAIAVSEYHICGITRIMELDPVCLGINLSPLALDFPRCKISHAGTVTFNRTNEKAFFIFQRQRYELPGMYKRLAGAQYVVERQSRSRWWEGQTTR